MPTVERSVTIQRSVPEVFSYMDDVRREKEWQPNLIEAVQEPPGPTGVGTRRRYRSTFLQREVVNEYRCTVYEMYVRVVYESTPESALQATAEFRWEPVGAHTRVIACIDASPGGVLKLIPKPVLEKASLRELEVMLENLKRVLES